MIKVLISAFSGLALTAALGYALLEPKMATDLTVNFNQGFIEEIQESRVDFEDRSAVLTMLMDRMGNTITVYPSEGYYYFDFYSNGDWIRGNLRFDKSNRDQGDVSFVYYKVLKRSESERTVSSGTLNKDVGFELNSIGDLKYLMKFNGREVVVQLYQAKHELTNPPTLYENESYVGPVFDESGVRFHLLFDNETHEFSYLLNSDFGFPETFEYSVGTETDHIVIGTRTEFAYYFDSDRDRYILIGVAAENIRNNSYYDGPFDQLPDNFVDGDELKEKIELYAPEYNGKLLSYGHFKAEENIRFAITNYKRYEHDYELRPFEFCRAKASTSSSLIQCLNETANH